ncbi:MAG: hypothetical protein M5T61_19065 [Acidimicrobiia bacterium]|nr:hypothetical protein [Acidimicrobiia bacterium]
MSAFPLGSVHADAWGDSGDVAGDCTSDSANRRARRRMERASLRVFAALAVGFEVEAHARYISGGECPQTLTAQLRDDVEPHHVAVLGLGGRGDGSRQHVVEPLRHVRRDGEVFRYWLLA